MSTSSIVFAVAEIWLVFLMSSLCALPVRSGRAFPGIGVNYGTVANNLPIPKEVAQLIQNSNIEKIKIYTADPAVLQAFENTGIRVVVGLPDEMIPLIGRSPNAAQAWVKERLAPFYPATAITHAAVGNEILTQRNPALINQLVPAMENIQKALVSLGMDQIKVSTPNSMAVLTTSYPPSSSAFQPTLLPVIKSLLDFLSRTGSSFMVNTYPYFAYSQDPHGISLDYALFRNNPGVIDSNSGLRYTSLFDAQVDAVYYAMNAAGNNQVPVIVSETGWPSHGDPNEIGCTSTNAQEYNNNLIRHVTSAAGTPYKPGIFIDTFIFALFNENLKPGPSSERNFGLLYPDKSSVYETDLFKSASIHKSPQTTMPCKQMPYTPLSISTSQNAPAKSYRTEATTPLWCIADSQAGTPLLRQSLDYACANGANCSAIQPGQSCFFPNTLVAHASYAYNSYFQRMGRKSWNCFFNNAAFVTTSNPSYGDCTYPSN
eukprot:c29859_g1_i1 orf=215-1675(-)